jgi:histone H2A
MFAIRNDEELNKMFKSGYVCGGGVLPAIHNVLVPKRVDMNNNNTGPTQTY